MASLKELLVNVGSSDLTEACKSKSKKKRKINESSDLIIDALTIILEMAESKSLTSDETKILETTIEFTFNSILESEYEDEYEDEDEYEYEDEDEDLEFECSDCGWIGFESELDEDGCCPECGSASVSETFYDEEEFDEDEIYESNMLNKTPADVKRAAKSYAKSAAGKKTVKNANRKRAKFAAKIDACAEKGKTFSFKAMTCIKSKKRR